MQATATNVREIRGHNLSIGHIKRGNGFWIVPSETGTKRYHVNLEKGTCTCTDFTYRQEKCKHLWAVQKRQERVAVDPYSRELPDVLPMPQRPTYKQKWSSYNLAQTNEKSEFQRLLAQLCSGVEEPSQTNGRPRLPLADMIFASVFKVYSTVSGRRFATDLENAFLRGHLSELPSYNSLFRYFEKPELTPILEMLIQESSKPLTALETSYAVDATGMATTHGTTWHHAKYKTPRMIEKRVWKKVHVITGVMTNVICAAKVTDSNEADSPHFGPLVETAAKNCDMSEVLADAAYLSKENLQTVVDHGATPYIAWKANSRITDKPENELWNRLYHLFALNRKHFLSKYGKRSNCETTFSMMKAKFGSVLRNKSDVAQQNEALAKCLCHNICCLISAIFELGIEPEFFAVDAID